jgi:hypothetical protein
MKKQQEKATRKDPKIQVELPEKQVELPGGELRIKSDVMLFEVCFRKNVFFLEVFYI